MNAIHTPGPWRITRDQFSPCSIDAPSTGDFAIAKVYLTDPKTRKRTAEHQANANLIAAAPELLAVVQRLFHSVNGFSVTFAAVNMDYACSQLRKELAETIREAQNAIAKATAT